MASKLPSLGDAPVDTKLVTESYPLPGNRRDLVSAIERILSLGGVQKLLIQLGQDIKAVRMVKVDAIQQKMDEEIPSELADTDLMSAARNAEMEDLVFTEELSPFEYLFRAFALLSSRNFRPKAVIVPRLSQLREWLRLNKEAYVGEVFGVQAIQHKEMPEGVLLLVASSSTDEETVALSLRLEMNMKENRDA